ncbi:hypothetical protein BUALT_Bualt10G0066400 [Buddleja alternifolia]|uniref:Uncharacterized protein n=1 Tax=Buddleja alternifolia TaxID=168488 RepID=A0AAV6X3U2_9LAMI|nr:hypothetical protein BUALT_Bualt10G0066400 [Buddleja alternifolia]
MATKPLTSEAIAITEKKMDMSLDDIIKISKTNVMKPKNQRVSNRGKKIVSNVAQDKSSKVQRFMDTRSSLRQGNQFPLSTEAARKAAGAPIRNRTFNRSMQFNVIRGLCLVWHVSLLLYFQKHAIICLHLVRGKGTICLKHLYWNRMDGLSPIVYLLLEVGLAMHACRKFGVPLSLSVEAKESYFAVCTITCFPCGPHVDGFEYWIVVPRITFMSDVVIVLKCKFGGPNVQKVAANGGDFTVKKPVHQVNVAQKQKPQTLDSLFANMKEQRMRVLSQQNNASRMRVSSQQNN